MKPPMRNRALSQVLALCGTLCAVCGVCDPASAQTLAEANAGVQLNFSTPGARSLGLGGAFVGLADDATAAYANPAGLLVLSEPEVSFEGRTWDFRNAFVQGGRLAGSPSGRGIDTVSGLVEAEERETVNGVSFLSAVYPRRSWAVAVYRHELASYRASFRTDGVFAGEERTLPEESFFDLGITGVGLSAACRLGSRFSIGAGIVSYDFSLLSRTFRYGLAAPGETGPGGLFGPSLFAPGNLVDTQTLAGDQRENGFNAGFRWDVGSGWTLGGVYREGPEFEIEALYFRGPLGGTGPPSQNRPARYDLPEVLGAGVAYQPTEFLTLALDYVYVEYSDLLNGVVETLLVLPGADLSSEAPFFKVDDAEEIHLGFESIVPFRRTLLALRAGAWYDPDHSIRYEGQLPVFQAAFLPGRDEFHYAAGFGFVVPKWQARFDAAFDYSDPVKTASFSTVVTF